MQPERKPHPAPRSLDTAVSEAELEEESRERRTRLQRLERLVDPAGLLGAPSRYVRVDSPHTLAPGVLDLVIRRQVRQGRERNGQVGVVGVVVVDFRRCVGGSASSRPLRGQEATRQPESAIRTKSDISQRKVLQLSEGTYIEFVGSALHGLFQTHPSLFLSYALRKVRQTERPKSVQDSRRMRNRPQKKDCVEIRTSAARFAFAALAPWGFRKRSGSQRQSLLEQPFHQRDDSTARRELTKNFSISLLRLLSLGSTCALPGPAAAAAAAALRSPSSRRRWACQSPCALRLPLTTSSCMRSSLTCWRASFSRLAWAFQAFFLSRTSSGGVCGGSLEVDEDEEGSPGESEWKPRVSKAVGAFLEDDA